MASNASKEIVRAVPDLNSAAEHLEPSSTVSGGLPSQNLPNSLDGRTVKENDAGEKVQDMKDRPDAENGNSSAAIEVGALGAIVDLVEGEVKDHKVDSDETEVTVEFDARSTESGLVEETTVDVGEAKSMLEDGVQTAETRVVVTKPVDSKDDEDAVDKGNVGDTEGVVVDVASLVGNGADQEMPKKRGRGRPRKYPAEKNQGNNVETRIHDLSEKRKRGRPPKSIVLKTQGENVQAKPYVQNTQGENGMVEEPESLEKRKRGRPPKSDVPNAQGENVFVKEEVEESSQVRKRGRPSRTTLDNTEHIRYTCHFQDEKKDGFSVSDLVWGKVRSHPWWPGQIVDESNASEIALKIQKENHTLIAYFGDNSFAWCDESQLKPFQAHFTQLEKQISVSAFVTAVGDVLEEVSRRVKLGMACNCFVNEAYDRLKDQSIVNSGIREGACVSAFDKIWIVDAFEPERLIDYIRALALSPYEGADRLDLAIVKAQLESFGCCSRCLLGLPAHVLDILYGGGLEDVDESSPPSKGESGKEVSDPSASNYSASTPGKGNFRRRVDSSQKRKQVTEKGRKKKSLSELMKESPHHEVSESGKTKKKRLDSLADIKTNLKQAKVGERMRQVAGLMKGSTPMLKPNWETLREGPSKVNHTSKYILSPSEMLGQLSAAAKDPLKGDGFLSTTVNFFTDFKDSLASCYPSYQNPAEIVGAKHGRRRSTNLNLASSDLATIGYGQDSYWSDIIVSDSAEEEPASKGHKRKGEYQTTWQRTRTKQEESAVSHSLEPNSGEQQDLQVCSTCTNTIQQLEAERPINVSEVEECMPTELVLTFGESDGLPYVTDLVRIFSCYGPLREAETEVVEKEKTAKVVFKRRADAEVALKSAGQYSLFEQASVSYRLRHLKSASKASDVTRDDLPVEDSVCLEVSGQMI